MHEHNDNNKSHTENSGSSNIFFPDKLEILPISTSNSNEASFTTTNPENKSLPLSEPSIDYLQGGFANIPQEWPEITLKNLF